jgi:uncharacterized BrkB/YihY/UPF0761 family membrane protein
MNTDKQEENQRLRIAQSLYRKKKHKKLKRNTVNKTWTVIMVVFIVIALIFLVIGELYFMDAGIPIPDFLKKIANDLNN